MTRLDEIAERVTALGKAPFLDRKRYKRIEDYVKESQAFERLWDDRASIYELLRELEDHARVLRETLEEIAKLTPYVSPSSAGSVVKAPAIARKALEALDGEETGA